VQQRHRQENGINLRPAPDHQIDLAGSSKAVRVFNAPQRLFQFIPRGVLPLMWRMSDLCFVERKPLADHCDIGEARVRQHGLLPRRIDQGTNAARLSCQSVLPPCRARMSSAMALKVDLVGSPVTIAANSPPVRSSFCTVRAAASRSGDSVRTNRLIAASKRSPLSTSPPAGQTRV
jgi:hypothetical protein